MNDQLNAHTASDPLRNITVSASAGTGKTYLLVSRIIRLLLNGAQAGNILALTFTRKAAGEMRERLQHQLWELASTEDSLLKNSLSALGVEPNDEHVNKSRLLYESVLFADQPIRISTFHAFCQELLQRFPMEADIPPGFELLESNALIQDQAWEALFQEASKTPNSPLAHALECLFETCNGLNNTQDALILGFLSQRSDWWAFTQGQTSPVDYATDALKPILSIIENPITTFIKQNTADMIEFQSLLNKNPNTGNNKHYSQLENALNTPKPGDAFNMILDVFLSKSLEPRKRSINKTIISKMGETGAQRFISLHEKLCEEILMTREYCLNEDALKTNRAWFLAGHHLLIHYQRIKREQRLLDFSDLEWKTYELLHNSDNALWVQYKLDQKIDHLLIDEFQDTNPTQWQLILPLLQEIASHENERKRTVFLVGDQKQSIYGFRRANPALQSSASLWLKDKLNAEEIPLLASWRSSPAIIDFVNRVFEQTELGRYLNNFSRHTTHKTNLWGHIEMLPLQIANRLAEKSEPEFRNPLLQPRNRYVETPYYLEGRVIAQKIQELLKRNIAIEDSGHLRALDYCDIYILLRNRTHISDIEQALADANIPFIGDQQDKLLDRLEIKDLLALLTAITMPFNNLALAHSLRSPIFHVSDDDLMQLASLKSDGTWLDRLQILVEQKKASDALKRAFTLLNRWHKDAEHLPTHDLLDRIYTEAELFARYKACVPSSHYFSIRDNLIRFIEMALEVDSGRYPSTIKFLARLKKLKQSQYENSNTPKTINEDSNVRVLTIHAAKGLEAPVVFLADTASVPKPKLSYKGIVDWPAHEQRPIRFFLSTTKGQMPESLNAVINKQLEAEQKEAANLLYVALTRAQHALFISGSHPSEPAPQASWYTLLSSVLSGSEDLSESIKSIDKISESFTSKNTNTEFIPDTQTLEAIINKPLINSLATEVQSPAKASSQTNDENFDGSAASRLKGILIHDYLNRLSSTTVIQDISELSSYLEISHNKKTILSCKQEAWDTFHSANLTFLYREEKLKEAYNEISILYENDSKQQVYGIIDRLVILEDAVWIVDYKTEPLVSTTNAKLQAAAYSNQLKRYADGVQKIWPDKTIKCGIIFTSKQHLEEIINDA